MRRKKKLFILRYGKKKRKRIIRYHEIAINNPLNLVLDFFFKIYLFI